MTSASRRLFESAVSQYARYRSGYPAGKVGRLAAQVGLDVNRRAIDIGCGSGQFTLPLARHAQSVTAIDPVPGMLARGRDTARADGVTNIVWLKGDSTRLSELVEPGAQLAAFAASFHWTDRLAVLDTLDAMLAPAGSVVVIGDDPDQAEEPDWDRAIAEVRSRFSLPEPAPGALTELPESHREMLQRSAFSRVHESTWSWTRRLDVRQVIGLQLSYSFSTPALLGDRVGAFCQQVRDAVLTLHPSGVVTEPIRVRVLVASRPVG